VHTLHVCVYTQVCRAHLHKHTCVCVREKMCVYDENGAYDTHMCAHMCAENGAYATHICARTCVQSVCVCV